MSPLEAAEAAARAQPSDPAAQARLAELQLRAQNPAAAQKSAERALKRDPINPRYHLLLGAALTAQHKHEAALAHFARAQKLAPTTRDPLIALTGSRQALGQHQAVLDTAPLLRQVLGAEAGILLARSALALPDPAAAIAHAEAVLAAEPRSLAAWALKGDAEALARLPDAALASYGQALRLSPRDSGLWNKRGVVLQAAARHEEAIRSFATALEHKPFNPRSLFHRGLSHSALGQPAEAAESYRAALRQAPGNVNAWNNLGAALEEMQKSQAALDAYAQAIAGAPDDEAALANHGRIAVKLGLNAEAQVSLQNLLARQPADAGARFLLAESLLFSDRFAEAITAFTALLAAHPDHPYALGGLLHAHQRGALWPGMEAAAEAALAATREGRLAAQPFYLMAATDDPALHLAGARIWLAGELARTEPLATPAIAPRDDGRIRIAYLSPDFRDHPVSLLAIGLFEGHDRARFETTGVMLGPPPARTPFTERLQASFDHYVNGWEMGDAALVARLREAGIDIAIDLAGFTTHSRPQLFALRIAPLQVNFLGISASMGAATHDYIVVDPVVAPPGAEAQFDEQPLRLPQAYMPNDNRRAIAPHCPPRAQFGLPDEGFVFAAFNLGFKITPPIFSAWCRLLAAIPGSVLWLAHMPAATIAALRAEATSRGIAPERLVLAERIPYPDHLARLALADLALDTFPYTGATTASDALWAGLPLLTIAGRSFNSRVAASLLHAVGLPELAVDGLDAYEATALALARDPARLAALRTRLATQRLASPLFDTARYVRDFEAGLDAIQARQRQGLPPAPITL